MVRGPDDTQVAFSDTDGDGEADRAAVFDAQGNLVGTAHYDPSTGDWRRTPADSPDGAWRRPCPVGPAVAGGRYAPTARRLGRPVSRTRHRAAVASSSLARPGRSGRVLHLNLAHPPDQRGRALLVEQFDQAETRSARRTARQPAAPSVSSAARPPAGRPWAAKTGQRVVGGLRRGAGRQKPPGCSGGGEP